MEILATSKDGNFEFSLVTSEHMENAMYIVRRAYYTDEIMLKAIEFSKYPEAQKDLEIYLVKLLKEGNSVIGFEKSTGKVACVSINSLHIQVDEFFDNHFKNLKLPMSIFIHSYNRELDNIYDLMNYSNNKCLFEINTAATLPEYRGKGLAKQLFEVSIEVAKRLHSAQDVSKPVPDVVTSFCSHIATQKIATALGFEKVADIDLNKWSFMGKTTGELLGIDHPYLTINYLKLF